MAARAAGAARTDEEAYRAYRDQVGSETRGRPRSAGSERAGRSFRVLGERELEARSTRRHVARLLAASLAVVVMALLGVGASQALIAERQLHLDTLQQQLTSAVATNQRLELSRAELDNPARILSVAKLRLKMVAPATVTYLSPVDPGPSVASEVAARAHTHA